MKPERPMEPVEPDPDAPPTESELAEARRLADALEDGSARGGEPVDALEVAHLLGTLSSSERGGGSADELAARRLRRELVADASRAAAARRPSPARAPRLLVFAAIAAGILLAVALAFLRRPSGDRRIAGRGEGVTRPATRATAPAAATPSDGVLAQREASARASLQRLVASRPPASVSTDLTLQRLAALRQESALSRLAWSRILESADALSVPGTPVTVHGQGGHS